MAHPLEARVLSLQDAVPSHEEGRASIKALVNHLTSAMEVSSSSDNSGSQSGGNSSGKIGTNKGKVAEEENPAYTIFPWLRAFHSSCLAADGRRNIRELESLMVTFTTLVTPEVNNCLTKPNRAFKLKRHINETITFFHLCYQDIKENVDSSIYLNKMTEIMALFLDMEIRASARGKESTKKVSSRLVCYLHIILDRSDENMLDSILKCRSIIKSHREVVSMLLNNVLSKLTPKDPHELLYVRLLLLYKLWKSVAKNIEEKRKLNKMAAERLKHPSSLLERSKKLMDVLPRIPKKKKNVTLFLMISKFNLKNSIKAFLVATKPTHQTQFNAEVSRSAAYYSTTPSTSSHETAQKQEETGSYSLINDIWSSLSLEAIGERSKEPSLSSPPDIHTVIDIPLEVAVKATDKKVANKLNKKKRKLDSIETQDVKKKKKKEKSKNLITKENKKLLNKKKRKLMELLDECSENKAKTESPIKTETVKILKNATANNTPPILSESNSELSMLSSHTSSVPVKTEKSRSPDYNEPLSHEQVLQLLQPPPPPSTPAPVTPPPLPCVPPPARPPPPEEEDDDSSSSSSTSTTCSSESSTDVEVPSLLGIKKEVCPVSPEQKTVQNMSKVVKALQTAAMPVQQKAETVETTNKSIPPAIAKSDTPKLSVPTTKPTVPTNKINLKLPANNLLQQPTQQKSTIKQTRIPAEATSCSSAPNLDKNNSPLTCDTVGFMKTASVQANSVSAPLKQSSSVKPISSHSIPVNCKINPAHSSQHNKILQGQNKPLAKPLNGISISSPDPKIRPNPGNKPNSENQDKVATPTTLQARTKSTYPLKIHTKDQEKVPLEIKTEVKTSSVPICQGKPTPCFKSQNAITPQSTPQRTATPSSISQHTSTLSSMTQRTTIPNSTTPSAVNSNSISKHTTIPNPVTQHTPTSNPGMQRTVPSHISTQRTATPNPSTQRTVTPNHSSLAKGISTASQTCISKAQPSAKPITANQVRKTAPCSNVQSKATPSTCPEKIKPNVMSPKSMLPSTDLQVKKVPPPLSKQIIPPSTREKPNNSIVVACPNNSPSTQAANVKTSTAAGSSSPSNGATITSAITVPAFEKCAKPLQTGVNTVRCAPSSIIPFQGSSPVKIEPNLPKPMVTNKLPSSAMTSPKGTAVPSPPVLARSESATLVRPKTLPVKENPPLPSKSSSSSLVPLPSSSPSSKTSPLKSTSSSPLKTLANKSVEIKHSETNHIKVKPVGKDVETNLPSSASADPKLKVNATPRVAHPGEVKPILIIPTLGVLPSVAPASVIPASVSRDAKVLNTVSKLPSGVSHSMSLKPPVDTVIPPLTKHVQVETTSPEYIQSHTPPIRTYTPPMPPPNKVKDVVVSQAVAQPQYPTIPSTPQLSSTFPNEFRFTTRGSEMPPVSASTVVVPERELYRHPAPLEDENSKDPVVTKVVTEHSLPTTLIRAAPVVSPEPQLPAMPCSPIKAESLYSEPILLSNLHQPTTSVPTEIELISARTALHEKSVEPLDEEMPLDPVDTDRFIMSSQNNDDLFDYLRYHQLFDPSHEVLPADRASTLTGRSDHDFISPPIETFGIEDFMDLNERQCSLEMYMKANNYSGFPNFDNNALAENFMSGDGNPSSDESTCASFPGSSGNHNQPKTCGQDLRLKKDRNNRKRSSSTDNSYPPSSPDSFSSMNLQDRMNGRLLPDNLVNDSLVNISRPQASASLDPSKRPAYAATARLPPSGKGPKKCAAPTRKTIQKNKAPKKPSGKIKKPPTVFEPQEKKDRDFRPPKQQRKNEPVKSAYQRVTRNMASKLKLIGASEDLGPL